MKGLRAKGQGLKWERLSFRRKPESSLGRRRLNISSKAWIPAFAGMTNEAVLFSLFVICHLALSPAYGEESRYFQNVTVETGDTLWSLAQRYLKDPKRWPEILNHNNLPTADPTVALPGQTLKVPVLLIKDELRAAKLVEAVADVHFRKRESAQWNRAAGGLELYQEDGLRTALLSLARVRFAVGEDLTLGANSFAIIRPDRLADDLGRGVSLVAGEAHSRGVRLITQTARIIPKTKETDYRAKIREDLATVVEVFKGATDVEAKGKTVLVPEGFATAVPAGLPPAPPMALPPMPEARQVQVGLDFETDAADALDLKNDAVIIQGGRISFKSPGKSGRGRPAEPKTNFHYLRLQAASSPDASKILWEDSLPLARDFNLRDTGLKDGIYYVRISFRDRLGFEGPFSEWKKAVIDSVPPELELEKPPLSAKVYENPVAAAGRTEPGSILFIAGKTIPLGPDGKFSTEIMLQTGMNRLSIVIIDAGGNRTEEKLELDYREKIAGKPAEAVKKLKPGQSEIAEEAKPLSAEAERLARYTLGLAVAGVIAVVIILIL